MERTYYPDHDKRYAHMRPEDRKKFPDEVKFANSRYVREKTYQELTDGIDIETALRLVGWEGRRAWLEKRIGKSLPDHYKFFGEDLLLLAKDIPITETYIEIE